MRNLKKVLALVLVFAMMLSTCVVASAASFPDVEATYQYAEAIDLLASLNILGGYEDGTFKPENNITRAEFAKVVYVIFNGMDDVNAQMFVSDSQFNDVAKTQWFNGHVNWASENAIVGGYGDGTFLPNNNVAVKEAIKMVVTAVTDKALTYPNGYIQEARAQKLLEDVVITSTDAPATRGQVAQLAYNLLFTPSRLCLTANGTDTYGNEMYKKNAAIDFVFGLSKWVDVTVNATYDNKWDGSTALEEGEVNITGKVVTVDKDGKEVVADSDTTKTFEYAGDANDLYGQQLKAYLNRDGELVALVSVSDVLEVTTADKLSGDNSIYYPYGVKQGEYAELDGENTKDYVFDTVLVQDKTGEFNPVNADVKVDGVDKVSLESICVKEGRNNTGKVTFIDTPDATTGLLDGVADKVVVEYQGSIQISKYSAATKTITLKNIGAVAFDDAIGHEAFADADYSTGAAPVWATYTVRENAVGTVYTLVPTTAAEGVLTDVNTTKGTAVVGGTTYTGFFATDANKTAVFNKLKTSDYGSTVKVYLDAAGYAVAYEIVESDTVYDLNLGKVIAASDSADKWGNNVKATLTVVTPDGTEKVLTLDTTNDTKTGDDVEVDFPAAYLSNNYDTSKIGSVKDKTADEVFFVYDGTTALDYTIVGQYIHYEVDDTTNEVVRVVLAEEIGTYAPSNSKVEKWSVEFYGGDKEEKLSYNEKWGFYIADDDKGETVKELNVNTVADSFVGMYYEENAEGELETAYYTASNIPTFANAGEFMLFVADGEIVAMVVETSPEAKTDDKVLGIVTGWNNVQGETKKNGNPTYRVEITMLVNGESQKFYTEDLLAGKLPDTLFDEKNNVNGLTESRFAKLQLMSDGKVDLLDNGNINIDYVDNKDLTWAYATQVRGNTVAAKEITAFTNSVSRGQHIDPETGKVVTIETSVAGEITVESLGSLRTCEETTFITIAGTPVDADDLNEGLFQKTVAADITAGGTIEVSEEGVADNAETKEVDEGVEGYYYVFAYEVFDEGEAADSDNKGALKTVYVFASPVVATPTK